MTAKSQFRATPADLAAGELSLRLAGVRAHRDRDVRRLAELYDGADDVHLSDFMSERGLLLTLGARLGEYCDLRPRFKDAIDLAAREAAPRGGLHEMITLDLATHLERGDVPCLPLKGSVLSRHLYGDAAARRASDIDLLVRAEDLDRASAVLHERGYSPVPDRPRGDQLPSLHDEFVDPAGKLPRVEVHWRVHWYETLFAPAMLGRATFQSDRLRRARPEDELASLLLFYARDGFVGVRMAADIAQWWDRFGHQIGPEGLQSVAAAHPPLLPALRAASTVVRDLLGVPGDALLGHPARLPTRERLAVRLADWPAAGNLDQIGANLALVDGLLSPPGSASGFMHRQLTDPAVSSNFVHAGKMLLRFGAALWALRRGRRWVTCAA